MRPDDLFRQAWEGLAAYRLRSLLALASVTIGVAALISVLAIGRGTHDQALAEFQALGGDMARVYPDPESPFWAYVRPGDADAALAAVPRAVGVWPVLFVSAVELRAGDRTLVRSVVGLPPSLGTILWPNISAGRFFSRSDEDGARRRAVLGPGLAETLLSGQAAPGQIVFLDQEAFEVTGVVAPASELASTYFGFSHDQVLVVPYLTLARLKGAADRADYLMVQARQGQDPEAVGRQVAAWLQRRHGGAPFLVQTFRSLAESFSRIARLITNVMALIAAVALAAGGMGITNIMLASVADRTREIGVRRALGARRQDVLRQFLLEALLVSGGGGLLGVALAWAPVLVARRWIPVNLRITGDAAAAGLALALLVGLAFGTLPAVRAARITPAEALRHEN